MLAFIATLTFGFLARKHAVRASWTLPERKQRALVAEIKQQQLALLLSRRILPNEDIGQERTT